VSFLLAIRSEVCPGSEPSDRRSPALIRYLPVSDNQYTPRPVRPTQSEGPTHLQALDTSVKPVLRGSISVSVAGLEQETEDVVLHSVLSQKTF
jgi:hypothetical protein